MKTAAGDSGAENIPELIEWVNGADVTNPAHDAFIHGVGAAMDIIADRMEELLPRCEDGKLHNLDEMTFHRAVPSEHRECEDCGAEIRGDQAVRYRQLMLLIKQQFADWQLEPSAGSPVKEGDS
ncbi:hypothetical protein [Natrinema amylolyticum]|uniref:hypothetical protein n=1 Tax=Natrinema amylolyticum TaxID=2878679 RepID=UPI001CFB22E7|nr:hypothetical protein [Natrinema amylolyticum]